MCKVSNVMLVLKSGRRCDVSNFRPAASKVFERIIFNRVLEHVKECLSPVQHGYMDLC